VRMAVHRLRKRYRQLLRDEIAQTLADAADVDEEMRAQFGAFSEFQSLFMRGNINGIFARLREFRAAGKTPFLSTARPA